jgi:hypothetical protein
MIGLVFDLVQHLVQDDGLMLGDCWYSLLIYYTVIQK